MAPGKNDRNGRVKSTAIGQKAIGSEEIRNKIAKAPEQNEEMREDL